MISFMQVFGAILVVAGHLGSDAEGYVYITRLFQFSMPLFMFMSGFLFRWGGIRIAPNLGIFLLNKARRLLVPYVVISTLAFVPKVWLSRWAFRPTEFSWAEYFHSLLYPWDNVIIFFWFLPTLFLIFAITACAVEWIGKSHTDAIVASLATISLFFNIFGWELTPVLNLTGVMRFLMWWSAGYFFAAYKRKIVEGLRLEKGLACVSLLFCFVAAAVLLPLIPKLHNACERIIIISLGLLFSVSLGLVYYKNRWRFLDNLYGYSYSIYLLSWFPMVAVRVAGFQLLDLPWYVVWPVSITAGIFIPYIIARFVKERFPDTSFLRLMVGV